MTENHYALSCELFEIMSEEPKEKQSRTEIEIQTDPETLKGVFANAANISHEKEEFVIDYLFVRSHPIPFGKVVSRIILTPAHAKRFLLALQDNVQRYEDVFGEIDVDKAQDKRNLQ